jgi:endonuclease/exonuclease/phosphatase family metal-dependent hydrolase
MVSSLLYPAETIKVATWNIEHLGGGGRGFSGIGPGFLPQRSDAQLKAIALLIRDTLKIDLVAVQEVAITDVREGENVCHQLNVITREMGPDWSYFLGGIGKEFQNVQPKHNLHNAFIWNTGKVRLVKAFDLTFSNEFVGQKRLFDRLPLIGYFHAVKDNELTNDFLLVNVHLASGQDNDENHLAALVIIEQNLKFRLKKKHIKEKDRIILGDFNDNPFAKLASGNPRYTDLAYRYMAWKKYKDLVDESVGTTRMDKNLKSIIDHILVNNHASKHMKFNSFERFMPVQNPHQNKDKLAKWRETFSDHFPLMFELKVAKKDDD